MFVSPEVRLAPRPAGHHVCHASGRSPPPRRERASRNATSTGGEAPPHRWLSARTLAKARTARARSPYSGGARHPATPPPPLMCQVEGLDPYRLSTPYLRFPGVASRSCEEAPCLSTARAGRGESGSAAPCSRQELTKGAHQWLPGDACVKRSSSRCWETPRCCACVTAPCAGAVSGRLPWPGRPTCWPTSACCAESQSGSRHRSRHSEGSAGGADASSSSRARAFRKRSTSPSSPWTTPARWFPTAISGCRRSCPG